MNTFTKDIVEYIGGTFNRIAIYTTTGVLKITDLPDYIPGKGWPPSQ